MTGWDAARGRRMLRFMVATPTGITTIVVGLLLSAFSPAPLKVLPIMAAAVVLVRLFNRRDGRPH